MLIRLFFIIVFTAQNGSLWAYTRTGFEEARRQTLANMSDSEIKKRELEYQKAKKLYSIPCQKGKIKACQKMAKAESVMMNMDESIRLHMIACNKGDMEACADAGSIQLMLGNDEEGKRLLTPICEDGKGTLKNLACLILRGKQR